MASPSVATLNALSLPLPSDTMDIREMDAARALLMGPYFSTSNNVEDCHSDRGRSSEEEQLASASSTGSSSSEVSSHGFVVTDHSDGGEAEIEPVIQRRPRSASETLEYLAALAERERCAVDVSSSTSTATTNSMSNSSSDDDSEAMPPPPPRTRQLRPRSVSNPEGMEKWIVAENNYSSVVGNNACSGRRHFVLPASILEEELKEARVVAARHFRTGSPPMIPEGEAVYHDDSSAALSQSHQQPQPEDDDGSCSGEDDISSQELLRQARSRLLEDLSESSVTGEKGILTLPHALTKYKEVYNKNGRIGIYTPQERAAIIARYHEKRSHRNWNKKIRYNCRKSLADSRLRVKGRFVKRCGDNLEQQQPLPKKKPQQLINLLDYDDDEEDGNAAGTNPNDQDMPDVNDPDAGFAPTADQPYRRLRRSTVT